MIFVVVTIVYAGHNVFVFIKFVEEHLSSVVVVAHDGKIVIGIVLQLDDLVLGSFKPAPAILRLILYHDIVLQSPRATNRR